MKTSDITAQLQGALPELNNSFGTSIAFSSLSAVGTLVTAVTASAHGKKTGQAVTITDVKTKNPVTLTRSGLVVTGETSFPHDLTEPANSEVENYTTANISGADEAIYNGSFQVASVPNRKKFTYLLPSDPVADPTGTTILEEKRIDGFNGRFTITVLSSTTFTYVVNIAPPGDAILDEALVFTKLRISRALTDERADESYTKQNTDENWLFVIPGDVNVSNDRAIESDAIAVMIEGADRRNRTIINFTILVFISTSEDLSGVEGWDEAQDIAANLYKSLAGFKPPSSLSDRSNFFCTPVGHGFFNYTKAYYVHNYSWQLVEDITDGDTFFEESRAFRDARLIFTNDFEEIIINTDVDLDDEIIDP